MLFTKKRKEEEKNSKNKRDRVKILTEQVLLREAPGQLSQTTLYMTCPLHKTKTALSISLPERTKDR